MSSDRTDRARVIPLRPFAAPAPERPGQPEQPEQPRKPERPGQEKGQREPLWRDVVGGVLRRERLAQERTLKDVAEAARISMPYLSELERGRKEASSEVLAAAAHALGLSLADLLVRVHGELAATPAPAPRTTVTSVVGRPYRAAGPHPRPGDARLCIAA